MFKFFFKFPNKDFFEISEYVGGKTLRNISYFLVALYLTTSLVLVLSEFNENIRNILFKNAPSEYINLLFIIGMFVGLLCGFKGIFRTSVIIAPIILLSLFYMFVCFFIR